MNERMKFEDVNELCAVRKIVGLCVKDLDFAFLFKLGSMLLTARF